MAETVMSTFDDDRALPWSARPGSPATKALQLTSHAQRGSGRIRVQFDEALSAAAERRSAGRRGGGAR
jgi:hypothetical protein